MAGMDFGKLMKGFQQVQERMQKLQEELAQRTVEATAGGGVVTVTANGRQEIVGIQIRPEVVDPDDVEMLQDLIVAATNDALKQAQAMVAEEVARLTGGLKLPGLS